jgi:hypothetical protein
LTLALALQPRIECPIYSHREHGDNGADGEHVGQETKEIGLVLVRSNMVKVDLPGIILLQQIEEGSK